MDYLKSDADLEKLVKDFEAGRLVQGQWHHAEHLAVCYWYLCKVELFEAIFRLKLGILKYNEQNQVPQTVERGYHETITLFFVKFVKKYIDGLDSPKEPLVDGLRPLIEGHSRVLPTLWTYYSRPRLNSPEARIYWVEPDLQPL